MLRIKSPYSQCLGGLRRLTGRPFATSRSVGLRQSQAAPSQPGSATFGASLGRFVASARRAATFTFYSALVIGALGFTGVATYYFAQELLLPSSDVQVFQRAFHLIEQDAKSRELLGEKLKAHGEQTNNRWAHNRPIASRRSVDHYGREHVVMQFHVDGEKNTALARLELIDNAGKRDFRYLVLEIPGHGRHYLINETPSKPKGRGFFGIQWGPKKN